MSDYNLEGVKWFEPDNTVTWSIADANYSDRNFQFSSFLPSGFEADLQAAFAKWSSVADINFVEVPDSDSTDIRLGLNSIDGPSNTVGITQYTNSGRAAAGGFFPLESADIEFDSDENWHLSNGHEVASSGFSLYPIALHEIGHAIGLAHYFAGPAIMNPVVSVSDLTSSDIDGIDALYGPRTNGGSTSNPIVSVNGPGETLRSSSNDVFLNRGHLGTTFVFDPGYGHDVVRGFVASGAGHDRLDLPAGDFGSLASVLRHTQETSTGAVIHDAVSGDTISLVNVSKLDLVLHRADLALHA